MPSTPHRRPTDPAASLERIAAAERFVTILDAAGDLPATFRLPFAGTLERRLRAWSGVDPAELGALFDFIALGPAHIAILRAGAFGPHLYLPFDLGETLARLGDLRARVARGSATLSPAV